MRRFYGTRGLHTVHDHVRDEAITWFIGFCEDEIDPEGRERFERWLKASPEHVQAYLQVSAFWEAAGHLSGSRKLALDELVQRAAAETNIVELDLSGTGGRRLADAARWRARRKPAVLAASFAALCLVSMIGLWWHSRGARVYETGVGEERTLILPDSSTVELDARSMIRVRFTKAARRVELLQGQALFRVMHNPALPFIVTSNNARVRDVGTQFDVRRDAATTVVTVLQGRVVAVATADSSTPIGKAVLVSAGEQVTLEPRIALHPERVNTFIATAWTEGKLVFDDTSLAEVIQQFNRYNPKPLTIEDAKLLALHVSGTFDTDDSKQLIQFLSQRFGLVAHESADEIRLSRG